MAHAKKKVLKSGRERWYARYRGTDGKWHEEGGFDTEKKALEFAYLREGEVRQRLWVSPMDSKMTFRTYVEHYYLPAAKHLEASTLAAYNSNLDRHFLPLLGDMPMNRILPATIQGWVNDVAGSLSSTSIKKYYLFLHSVFSRAQNVDKVIAQNPCTGVRMPKVIPPQKVIATPEQFDALLERIPLRYQMLVLLAIETGMRWGELTALRPIDIDFARHVIRVSRTLVEVSKKYSPTGERLFFKDYPKDDEWRDVKVDGSTCSAIKEHMLAHGVREDSLLFTGSTGMPLSRNNFRTKVWLPALGAAELDRAVTFHKLRGSHASWVLAGGADLQVVKERLGHRSIVTTQQYLSTLDDAGDRAIAAFRATRDRAR